VGFASDIMKGPHLSEARFGPPVYVSEAQIKRVSRGCVARAVSDAPERVSGGPMTNAEWESASGPIWIGRKTAFSDSTGSRSMGRCFLFKKFDRYSRQQWAFIGEQQLSSRISHCLFFFPLLLLSGIASRVPVFSNLFPFFTRKVVR